MRKRVKIIIVLILFFVCKSVPQEVKIREYSILAKFLGKCAGHERYAITLGNTIHISCSKRSFLHDTEWVKHELGHVMQYRRYGNVEFVKRYLFYLLVNGYKNHPLEKEASNYN